MAQLRYVVLLIASAFLVLQLSEQVTATIGKASSYAPPYVPSACFGFDPTDFPSDGLFAAGGDSPSANIWDNGANCDKFFLIKCLGNGCKSHGPIRVKIVDHCPNGCSGGRAFDLSDKAFLTIAHLGAKEIDVEYSSVT